MNKKSVTHEHVPSNSLLDVQITCHRSFLLLKLFLFNLADLSRILVLQSQSVVSPVRNDEGSPSPGGASSRDLGGSSRDLGGSSREIGASSSPIRSLEGSDLKSYSNSDTRSRERWRSMARRGSVAEGCYDGILGQGIYIVGYDM